MFWENTAWKILEIAIFGSDEFHAKDIGEASAKLKTSRLPMQIGGTSPDYGYGI